MERKIGVPFLLELSSKSVLLVPMKAEHTNACEGCYFKEGHYLNCLDVKKEQNLLKLGSCDSIERADHTNIVFKEVLPTFGEQIKQSLAWEAYKWTECHKNQKAKYWMGVYLKAKERFPWEIRRLIKTEGSPWKHKENLAPFWETFINLINKRMKPITIKDLKELIAEQPDDAEVVFLDEGTPVSISDIELDTKKETPICTIALE